MNKEQLQEAIKYHNRLYWEDNNPEITDIEYDSLINQLKSIDPTNYLVVDVDGPIAVGDTIKHPKMMLSLDKAFSLEEILKWGSKIIRSPKEKFSLSPKFDGIASTYYHKKQLLVTRGRDGLHGENVTHKLPLIDLESDQDAASTDIIGEVLVKKSEFKNTKATRKSGEPFKTERNMAAGIMTPARKDTAELIGIVKLTMVDYKKFEISTEYQYLEKNWETIVERFKDSDYPLDGVVIRVTDEQYHESLGVTSHHPRGSIAFKFNDNSKRTIVRDIKWQVGRTRKLTPVAVIDPIVVNGVTIESPTLHNAKRVIDFNLHIGDIAYVSRHGDVIPHVDSIEPGDNRVPIKIDNCPNCDGALDYQEPELYCLNLDCGGSLVRQLVHAVKTVSIEELGEPTIQKMVDDLEVKSLADILSLEYEDILTLDGFAETSANTLYDNIQLVIKKVEDWKILASLNIKGIGKTLAKQLFSKMTFSELTNLSLEELEMQPNFSFERSYTLIKGLEENSELIGELYGLMSVVNTKLTAADTRKTICFSGSLPQKKSFYKSIADTKGLNVVASVTSKLTYLVSSGEQTSKLDKAQKRGIPILTIEEFLEL
jgi:DNA ligase (NAD+)